MEKDHLRSRNNNDRRNSAGGGFKGRGNVSGSISYAEFRRNGGSKARDERNAKNNHGKVEEPLNKGRFGESFVHEKSVNARFGETNFGRTERNFARNERNFGKTERNFGRTERSLSSNERSFGKNERNFGKNERTFGKNERTFGKSFEKKERQPKFQAQPTYEKSQFVDYNKPMRLNRFLANAGICSRREADGFIQAGVVTVNGNVVTELGSRVVPNTDKVLFHEDLVKIERRVYILLNKPKDYVTTAEDIHAKKTVLDLVKGACPERIYPVGRLDRNTTGVLLLTNDGELTSKLTHPSFNKKKIYQVTLDHDVADADVKKITSGIMLEDGEIKVDEFSYIKEGDRKNVGVEIHSGRNRIVRRIFESLGYKVMRLDRVYFAGLTKKNVPRGKWRFLSEKEVVFLKMNANNPTENC